jgi:hypothetical protein
MQFAWLAPRCFRSAGWGQVFKAGCRGIPFLSPRAFSLARVSSRLGEAVHKLRPGGECQMQKLSITSASCRLHLPLPRALAVQAAVILLGHQRPNPSVKGTSRQRAAPYVER